jgi:sec-independent protein translocase protein TatB
MFEIGWSELLVIAVVAIIVVGPKDLPRMLRTFGNFVGKARRMAFDFQRQFNDVLREAERQADLEDVRKTLAEVKAIDPVKDVKNTIAEAKSSFEEAVALPKPGTAAEPRAETVAPPAQPTPAQAEMAQRSAEPATVQPATVQPETAQPATVEPATPPVPSEPPAAAPAPQPPAEGSRP